MRRWEVALIATMTAILAGGTSHADAPTVRAKDGASIVARGYPFQFPRDYGSHPGFRTEWWYITGWLDRPHGTAIGFQITFFRSRTDPGLTGANPSAFSPSQLLIAHAAIGDAAIGRLIRDQRIARAGFDLARASEQDTSVFIDRWRLDRLPDGYRADIQAEDFTLNLTMRPTQLEMRNGEQGYSQKGPRPESASYYYSIPHLQVAGSVTHLGHAETVHGEAWLDHEWSSEYLDPQAQGWDWIGLNFVDGSALMAFRIRARNGSTLWAGGTWRDAHGATRALEPREIEFVPLRQWRSARTGTDYPVRWSVRAAGLQCGLLPLMQDQENDTRATTGAIYWEGAVRALRGGREIGRGYLELTGYDRALKLN